MEIAELIGKANKGDLGAVICLGDYYMDQNAGNDMDEAAKWYEKAAEHNVFYAVHMAANANYILALASSAIRRKVEFGYEFSRDDWKKVVDLSQKEIKLIQCGAPDAQPGAMEDAVSRLNQAKYEMAICCYELKDYSAALALAADSQTPKGKLLYAVIINRETKQNMADASRLLANAFVNAENATTRSFEEEKYFALAAVILSGVYHYGTPGFTSPDMNAAVRTLNIAIGQLKVQEWVQFVRSELAHYRPKMLGGYKYV